LTDTLWGYTVLYVMRNQKALHLLTALTFVFVNLVCPCASASMTTTGEVELGSHQHHEAPADSDCPHRECPDCKSAVVVSCDTGALIPSSSVSKLDLDDDSPILLTSNSFRIVETPHLSTGPPGYLSWHPSASPVSRYDSQIE
jgi:hypothetical protein